MDSAMREAVISRLGDASGKCFELLERAEALAAKVMPNTSEYDDFFNLIGEINNYLASYGFALVVIVVLQEEGCRIRLSMRDNAPTDTLQ